MPAAIDNDHVRVVVNDKGRIESVLFKALGHDLIQEPRLARCFRINLPYEGRLDHYVSEEGQDIQLKTSTDRITVYVDSLRGNRETYPIAARFHIEWIRDHLSFRYEIENATDLPLAEIWFPILGGLRGLGERLDTECLFPGYTGEHRVNVFRNFTSSFLGNEPTMLAISYPECGMPWFSVFNRNLDLGLYFAEYNRTLRKIAFCFQLFPGHHQSMSEDNWPTEEEAGDEPLGLVFSKVAFPHTKRGSFTSGEFVVQLHRGDWHRAAKLYRAWFMAQFPFDKSGSWLRKEQAWFSSIIYQPEDRLIATTMNTRSG